MQPLSCAIDVGKRKRFVELNGQKLVERMSSHFAFELCRKSRQIACTSDSNNFTFVHKHFDCSSSKFEMLVLRSHFGILVFENGSLQAMIEYLVVHNVSMKILIPDVLVS